MKKFLLSISILTAFIAHSQVIFQENFAAYSLAPLSGQGSWTNNSSLPGGLGSCSGSGCISNSVQAFAMTYPSFATTTQALKIGVNQDAVGTAITNTTSGFVYISFMVNFSDAVNNPGSSSSQDFFRVMSGGNYNTSFRLGAYKNGASFNLFFQKGSGPKITSGDLVFNQNHLVVLKYAYNPGVSDDVVSLLINPSLAGTEPAATLSTSAVGSGESDFTTGIDRMNFRSNFTTIPTGYIGGVKVSNSWNALLNTAQFDFNAGFTIAANNVKSGVLTIISDRFVEKTTLSIYDILGHLLESKSVSLSESTNDISISPILSSGVFIVELTNGAEKFVQKIGVN